jgi:hypothetical protein
MNYQTITREQAKELIEKKLIVPACLYEPEHAPKGTKFIFVDFGSSLGKRFYRCKEEK